jgi:hypothetical protein
VGWLDPAPKMQVRQIVHLLDKKVLQERHVRKVQRRDARHFAGGVGHVAVGPLFPTDLQRLKGVALDLKLAVGQAFLESQNLKQLELPKARRNTVARQRAAGKVQLSEVAAKAGHGRDDGVCQHVPAVHREGSPVRSVLGQC